MDINFSMQDIIDNHPDLHRAICESAVKTLNEALAADPVAINRLFNAEVVVNRSELAEHPTIQIGCKDWLPEYDRDKLVLRPLGVINGLFGVDDKSWGFIAVQPTKVQTPSAWIDHFFIRIGPAPSPSKGPWENSGGMIGQSTWNQPEPNEGDPYLSIATVESDEGLNYGRRHPVPEGTGEANAALIRAAPELKEQRDELLAALEEMLKEYESEWGSEAVHDWPHVLAAIAKAKGE